MLMQASRGRPTSAHVIVMGNEKGGAGKSTIAMHVAVGLMNFGQRVATIDLDLRQKTLGARPNLAHLTARHEILNFLEKLRLPLDERAQRRAAAQAEWLATRDQPLEVHDVIAE